MSESLESQESLDSQENGHVPRSSGISKSKCSKSVYYRKQGVISFAYLAHLKLDLYLIEDCLVVKSVI